MSKIKSEILEIIETFRDYGGGIYNEDEEEICDVVENFFEKKGIKEYDCNTEVMFDNAAIDIYSFSCGWIEDGKLESLLNIYLERV